jgi:hypothetical protein
MGPLAGPLDGMPPTGAPLLPGPAVGGACWWWAVPFHLPICWPGSIMPPPPGPPGPIDVDCAGGVGCAGAGGVGPDEGVEEIEGGEGAVAAERPAAAAAA